LEIVRGFRLFALLCPLAVLLCELISHPFVNMGVCDDGPYILMAKTLATTGHVVYNGWANPMLGWQLYIGAAFIKLFGFSFTAVRMSTLLVSLAIVILLHRIFVRTGVTERNATLTTLTLALTPLYLAISVTYMTDIFGLFAIVLCLYSCLRALQAATSRATLLWILFAVGSNAIFGTARQIAWLGILVMVPSTLWLLRGQRRVLISGSFATLAGAIFIFVCMQWLKHQPYSIPEQILPKTFPLAGTLWTLSQLLLEVPLILLPIFGLFLLRIRKQGPRVILIVSALTLGYVFLFLYPSHLSGDFVLEPTVNDWIGIYITFAFSQLHGVPPVLIPEWLRIILTIASFGGALCFIASLVQTKPARTTCSASPAISWRHLGVLLAPFAVAYLLLLIPRATGLNLSDRYLLPLLMVALLCITRYFQDSVQPQLPVAAFILVGLMALYGVTFTHDAFAFYRARVALAAELRAAGVPDTSVNNGWEYNLNVELQHASHINDPHIRVPADAFIPTPPIPNTVCSMGGFWGVYLPHIHPVYNIAFDPKECSGPAPFTPVQYSRWIASSPGTLYVVRTTATETP
jgi:hypothetical protein